MMKLLQDTKYLMYVIFHPFDGFYETKYRGKGNIVLAVILLFLYGVVGIFRTQYTGFIFNENKIFDINSFSLFMASILPVILFFVSNWSTTSLMNGKGTFKDIFIVTCYSLITLILFETVTVVLSNGIIIDEGPILTAFEYIGKIWFCFLIFSGLCTIHEYAAFKNILTLLVTVIAAIIIIFLSVLYLSLMQKVFSFITTIATEVIKRW